MYNLAESIIFGFREIFNYRVMKIALSVGLVITALWAVIGYFIWDGLIAFSASFLDLLPFSMLRENGALILSSFLWFSLVLITFALILFFFSNKILEKVSKEKYNLFSILLIFASALVWSIIWFFKGEYFHLEFLKLLNLLPFETVEVGISYLLGIYFIYIAITVTTLITTSFLSEMLLKGVHKNYFPYDDLLKEDEVATSKIRVKDITIYMVVSIFTFPLLFIPILNFVIQLILWVWIIKDTLINDSSALLIPRDKRESLSVHKFDFMVISVVTSLFNFLPLFNVFGPFFGEIAMFHYLKQIEKEL